MGRPTTTTSTALLTAEDPWSLASTGIEEVSIARIFTSGGILLAATSGGIYRSSDGGEHWELVDSLYVAHCFAPCDSMIVAGTPIGDVIRSSDHGRTWTRPDSVMRGIDALLFSERVLFAAGGGEPLHFSTDRGAHWNALPNPPNRKGITTSLAPYGSDLLAGTFGPGVMRSTDNGLSWAPTNDGLAGSRVMVLAQSDGYLFAGLSSGGGVSRSTDRGQNWHQLNVDVGWTDVTAVEAKGDIVFVGTAGKGLHRSTDNGMSWTLVHEGTSEFSVRAMASLGSDLFVGTWGNQFYAGGLFRSWDNGENWVSVSPSFLNMSVYSFLVIDTSLLMGTEKGIFLSTDHGVNWSLISPIGTSDLVKCGNDLFGNSGVYVYRYTRTDTGWTASECLSGVGRYGILSPPS